MQIGVNLLLLKSTQSPTPQELRDQEKHIEQLRGAVRAKGQPLKVAQVHCCFCCCCCCLHHYNKAQLTISYL